MKRISGKPATLGSTAAAQVHLIVWCGACGHRTEPDPAEMAVRYGAPPRRSGTGTSAWFAVSAARAAISQLATPLFTVAQRSGVCDIALAVTHRLQAGLSGRAAAAAASPLHFLGRTRRFRESLINPS